MTTEPKSAERPGRGEITRLLEAMRGGNTGATEELVSRIYPELRRLAASKMEHEPPGQTLQPTALVHEAWLRLIGLMKESLLTIAVCSMLFAPFFGLAAPTPGCADPIAASTWWGKWSDGGGYRYLRVGDGLTYLIVGFSGDQIWPDTTGQWDWIEPYSVDVYLTNAPGTSWYSSSDTNVSFDFHTSLLLKMRGPSAPSTNAPPVYLDMELSANEGPFICLATYAGTPTVTYVPEGTYYVGYTVATAPLSWARLCVGSSVASPGIPVTIRRVLPGSSQVELSWGAVTNRLYQVQCCSDLSQQQWTILGSPMAGTGVSHLAIDAEESQKFYRILEFP